jgi:hypothetical protein
MSKEIMANAISAVQLHQGTNESLKINLIEAIVALFKAHPTATPAMVTAGYDSKDSKSFVGRARGAWLCHKSGIAAGDLNVLFIANHYDDIKVMSTAKEQKDEILRVYKEVRATAKALTASNNASGKASIDAITELNYAITAVKNLPLVGGAPFMAKLALAKASLADLEAMALNVQTIQEGSLV